MRKCLKKISKLKNFFHEIFLKEFYPKWCYWRRFRPNITIISYIKIKNDIIRLKRKLAICVWLIKIGKGVVWLVSEINKILCRES